VDTAEFAKWKAFQARSDARYVALALPRMLMRGPYEGGHADKDFRHAEWIDGDHDRLLWGNAAWALAGRLLDSYQKTGWFADIRGPNGGVVDGLAVHLEPDEPAAKQFGPTEVALSIR